MEVSHKWIEYLGLFPSDSNKFSFALFCNTGQPSKAGALEAFWAPVLTKTQPLQASLTLLPCGGK